VLLNLPQANGSTALCYRSSMPVFRQIGIHILAAAIPCGAAFASGQGNSEKPAWCRQLPRPEYSKLQRIPVADTWFEVYKVALDVFAIYEPHQVEETISYLILGHARALLFDTGMGIGDLKALTTKLTTLPVIVLNSHTHNDHVGDNWQFDTVYGMDTEFTRQNAKGSKADAQAEIAPGEVCGALPAGFDRPAYATRPWHVTKWLHDGDSIDLGGRTIEVIATPGHTPDSICLFDRANRSLFSGDTYYPGPIWLYRPETDLIAYGKSVLRLVTLQPQVRLVLGAHNVPVAPPLVLGELAAAFEKVQAGQVQYKSAGEGKVTYQVGSIEFLMKPPTSAR
jgi:glyoxylase-like metal-dependent hydrolase (beta-lactamase superfamily II)